MFKNKKAEAVTLITVAVIALLLSLGTYTYFKGAGIVQFSGTCEFNSVNIEPRVMSSLYDEVVVQGQVLPLRDAATKQAAIDRMKTICSSSLVDCGISADFNSAGVTDSFNICWLNTYGNGPAPSEATPNTCNGQTVSYPIECTKPNTKSNGANVNVNEVFRGKTCADYSGQGNPGNEDPYLLCDSGCRVTPNCEVKPNCGYIRVDNPQCDAPGTTSLTNAGAFSGKSCSDSEYADEGFGTDQPNLICNSACQIVGNCKKNQPAPQPQECKPKCIINPAIDTATDLEDIAANIFGISSTTAARNMIVKQCNDITDKDMCSGSKRAKLRNAEKFITYYICTLNKKCDSTSASGSSPSDGASTVTQPPTPPATPQAPTAVEDPKTVVAQKAATDAQTDYDKKLADYNQASTDYENAKKAGKSGDELNKLGDKLDKAETDKNNAKTALDKAKADLQQTQSSSGAATQTGGASVVKKTSDQIQQETAVAVNDVVDANRQVVEDEKKFNADLEAERNAEAAGDEAAKQKAEEQTKMDQAAREQDTKKADEAKAKAQKELDDLKQQKEALEVQLLKQQIAELQAQLNAQGKAGKAPARRQNIGELDISDPPRE